MKKLILLSIFTLQLNISLAWGIVGEFTEEEYRTLGINFPSVGYFTKDDENPFGSGVLIDTNIEGLNGRVVLTAAHVLDNELGAIYFHIGSLKRGGHAIIHPAYHTFMEENKPHDIPYFSYDIALYLLDEPIHDIPLSALNLDLSFEELLRKKWFANCGFGRSGQLSASSEGTDTNRRACYNYASQKLNETGRQDAVVSYQTRQEGVIIKETEVKYPAGSVLTLTPDCFLEPCGSIADGDSGGGVFLADGGLLIGIIAGTDKVEISGYTPINPSHSDHIQLEDETQQETYKERSVLVGFHREWLKESFATLASGSTLSSSSLPEPYQFTKDVDILVVKTPYESHECEFAITTFPNSYDTALRALSAKCDWSCVNNRAISEESRYSAAMNLFESTNKTIQTMGCLALMTLSKDSAISDVHRGWATLRLFESGSPSICKMGIEGYKHIAEDVTASVPFRIDAAMKLIFSLKDLSYRRCGVDYYLSLAERDDRIIPEDSRFGDGVVVLLGIKDKDIEPYIIYKLQELLKDEHTDEKNKAMIRSLFLYHRGFDIEKLS